MLCFVMFTHSTVRFLLYFVAGSYAVLLQLRNTEGYIQCAAGSGTVRLPLFRQWIFTSTLPPRTCGEESYPPNSTLCLTAA